MSLFPLVVVYVVMPQGGWMEGYAFVHKVVTLTTTRSEAARVGLHCHARKGTATDAQTLNRHRKPFPSQVPVEGLRLGCGVERRRGDTKACVRILCSCAIFASRSSQPVGIARL